MFVFVDCSCSGASLCFKDNAVSAVLSCAACMEQSMSLDSSEDLGPRPATCVVITA